MINKHFGLDAWQMSYAQWCMMFEAIGEIADLESPSPNHTVRAKKMRHKGRAERKIAEIREQWLKP